MSDWRLALDDLMREMDAFDAKVDRTPFERRWETHQEEHFRLMWRAQELANINRRKLP